ncbi:MAG: phosphatidylserine decarboxylase [Bacteroidota bacterium]
MESVASVDYYSDPYFTVYKVPQWRADVYKFFSVYIWGNLPGNIQRRLSAFYASNYDKPYSKWIIEPYIRFHYRDKNYLDKFSPPEGKDEFESFQDFFIRRFKDMPKNQNPWVWPCEGLLCDVGEVRDIESVLVKFDRRNVNTIFGVSPNSIPGKYHFTNVFLHNKNYHRIHAPVNGKISRIQHVPGDLVVLRPWIYMQNPSLPAFRNERYNIDITDEEGRTWYMSIVGGPAVGTIKLPEAVKLGANVEKLEELATFYLGSTCCMAAPEPPRVHSKNTFVEVGATY